MIISWFFCDFSRSLPLVQAFARLSAVYGGTYMLCKPECKVFPLALCFFFLVVWDSVVGRWTHRYVSMLILWQVEFDEEGKVIGVTSEGETAKCKKIVCDPSYLPNKVILLFLTCSNHQLILFNLVLSFSGYFVYMNVEWFMKMMFNHIKTGSEDWYSCSGHRNYEPPYSKHQWLSLSTGHHTPEAVGPQVRHVSSFCFLFVLTMICLSSISVSYWHTSLHADRYVFCCSYSHNVAPKGKFIAFVSTDAETDNPQTELKAGIDLLGPVDEIFFDMYDRYEPVNEPASDNCFISTVSHL